jgi:hypothetical protein
MKRNTRLIQVAVVGCAYEIPDKNEIFEIRRFDCPSSGIYSFAILTS